MITIKKRTIRCVLGVLLILFLSSCSKEGHDEVKGYAVKFSSAEGLLVAEGKQSSETSKGNRKAYWIQNGSEKFLGKKLEVILDKHVDQSYPAIAKSIEIKVDEHQSVEEIKAIILSLKYLESQAATDLYTVNSVKAQHTNEFVIEFEDLNNSDKKIILTVNGEKVYLSQ